MSTATPGNINAVDILRSLDARATGRDWRILRGKIDDDPVIWIVPSDPKGEAIACMLAQNDENNAQLILEMRNLLPELIRSMDNRDFQIAHLKHRVRELEEKLSHAPTVPRF